jgi:DHA1 family purine ribonucleoside efflux pump-like MFS transporter
MLPAMARTFHVTEGLAGSLTSVFAIAIVITILPATRLSMRYTRRQVIVTTVTALVASNLIVGTAPGLPMALAGRFLGGAAHGLLASAMPSVVTRIVPPRHAPAALGIVLAGNSAGLAVGAPLTAVLSSWVGWRGSFLIMAGFGALLALALHRVVPPIRIKTTSTGTLWSTLRTPGVVRISTSWALILLGHYAVLTFIAPLFLALGGGESHIGLPLMVLGIAGVIGVLAAGRIGDRTLAVATIASGGLVGVAFVALALAPPMWVVFVLLTVWGAGSAASLLLNQRCVLLAGYQAPEMAMSVALLINQFGIAMGATLGGITIEHFGPRCVPVAAAIGIAGGLLLFIGIPRILNNARTARAEQAYIPLSEQ